MAGGFSGAMAAGVNMAMPLTDQFKASDVRLPTDTELRQPPGKAAACHPGPPGALAGLLLLEIAGVNRSVTGNKVASGDATGGPS